VRLVTPEPALDTSVPALLQEERPAGTGEGWLFHAYCNALSECLGALTGRMPRSFRPGAGEMALGQSVGNRILKQQARSPMTALSYSGTVSLDRRFDRRSGMYKPLDFNPRCGAVFRLLPTDAGVDVVSALVALGRGMVQTAGLRTRDRHSHAPRHVAGRSTRRRRQARVRRP
jgi:predicted ATP-grasp superfamily ATP-dependent carboligase